MWVSTKENIPDLMTKPLPVKAHTILRNMILNTINEDIYV